MNLKSAFQDSERAVSPVIGVILMVAITVILAAVIGTFVLGLGDSLGDNQPTAQIGVDLEQNTSTPANYDLTIEHKGGDRIDSSTLDVIVTDEDGTEISDTNLFTDPFTVGNTQSATFTGEGSGNTTDIRVRVVHQPSDSILVDNTIEVDNGAIPDSGSSLGF